MHGRLLIVRGGALGDFVLTLPVMEALGSDGWVVDLCCGDDHARLARRCQIASSMFRLDDVRWGGLWCGGEPGPLASELQRYDLVLVLRPVDRIATVRHLDAAGVGRTVVHDPRPPEDGSVHAADHLLSAIGTAQTKAVPRMVLPDSLCSRGRERLRAVVGGSAPVALLFPGAGADSKRWPLPRFLELAVALNRRGVRPVLVMGPVERERIGPAPRRAAEGVAEVLEIEDLLALAGVCAAARVVIGNDSGPAHLAAALGTPVLALFGPTDERTWGPRGDGRVRILRAGRGAEERRRASMENLPVEPVIAAAVELAIEGRSSRQ